MKAQHTPGSWWAGKHRNSDNVVDQIIISDNETNYRIAGLNVSNHGRKEEEQTANALLIAAAPELLEALKAYVALDKDGIFYETTAKAKAVIAKAEGR